MPTPFQQWCLDQFGYTPRTLTEIWYFSRWYEQDRTATEAAQAELEQVSTVDDLLRAGRA